MKKNAKIPTVMVIFGATGDLMARKITPALYRSFKGGKLHGMFKVVGVSMDKLDDNQFKERIAKNLAKHKVKNPAKFLKAFSYVQGRFEKKSSYTDLAKALKEIDYEWRVCANKLFYLAVPPQFYDKIFRNLASSGLTKPCSAKEGWTRVIVEKPFGKDLKTAKKLDRLLGKLFREEQIYRIDHYLAKETLQNIHSFRFSNNLFEQSLNNRFVESIDIKLLESLGVENRGSFYDGLGTLRDVGQNHLLQMLSLVTMDKPAGFDANSIRENRARLLEHLKIPSKEEARHFSIRGQYKGYGKIKGVKSGSKTETYFKVRALVDSPRWKNVPITIESGKRMGKPLKEIAINFKHPVPCLCPNGMEHARNRVVLAMEPKEGIFIELWSKKPGLNMKIEKRQFGFLLRKTAKKTQYVEEYEKLLLDCIAGDQTLFVSTKEVEAMWRFIDSIVTAWKKNEVPLQKYKPNSAKMSTESMFVGEAPTKEKPLKQEIGIVGLGKMGGNIARRLIERDWVVAGYNKDKKATKALEKEGLFGTQSLKELVSKLSKPKLVWVMVPAGKPVDSVMFGEEGLDKLLSKGDIVIDGGNSRFEESVKRGKKFAKKGIKFVDVGVSGGPEGARHGSCLMIGGEKANYDYLHPLFLQLAVSGGEEFFEGTGAGHFVKMVHNGIEYGMMQSIAEGFALMKKSRYNLDLTRVASVYNNGSVIESSLIGWMKNAFDLHGPDMKGVSGTVAHTGEGAWTVKIAKKMGAKVKVIEDSLRFRVQSAKKPSYAGKLVSSLREQFGGHSVKTKAKK